MISAAFVFVVIGVIFLEQDLSTKFFSIAVISHAIADVAGIRLLS